MIVKFWVKLCWRLLLVCVQPDVVLFHRVMDNTVLLSTKTTADLYFSSSICINVLLNLTRISIVLHRCLQSLVLAAFFINSAIKQKETDISHQSTPAASFFTFCLFGRPVSLCSCSTSWTSHLETSVCCPATDKDFGLQIMWINPLRLKVRFCELKLFNPKSDKNKVS